MQISTKKWNFGNFTCIMVLVGMNNIFLGHKGIYLNLCFFFPSFQANLKKNHQLTRYPVVDSRMSLYFQASSLLKDKCPKEYAWITSEYNKKRGYSLSICDDTEYGCCSIPTDEISCAERTNLVFFDDDTYSEYLENNEYSGEWSLRLAKADEEGTNCPSIEEIIYDYSAKEEDNYPLSLFCVSFISNFIIMSLIFLCRFCNKKEYEKTRSFEASDIENTNGGKSTDVQLRGSA